MKRYIVIFRSAGDWKVYHEPDGRYSLSENCMKDVFFDIESQCTSVFAFDIDALCDPDIEKMSDVMYDWR